MNLYKQPNSWSCLSTAFEMIGNFPIGEIEEYLGVNGSEILYPDLLPSNSARRTIPISECIRFMVANSYAVTPIIMGEQSGPRDHPEFVHDFSTPTWLLNILIAEHPGVMTGFLSEDKGHAVAWCPKEKLIFDPNGTKYPFTELKMKLEIFWLCSHLTMHPNYLKL